MKANLVADFKALPSRLKIAGAVALGALAPVALDSGLTRLPSPDPPREAPTHVEAPAPAGLRNLAYYPEQLAALASMADFEPRADSGTAAIPAAEPAAPVARKPIRHVAARAQAPAPAVAAPSTADPPVESRVESQVEILGVSIPRASAIGARVVAVRDSASHLGEAAKDLGCRIATFWR